MLQPLQDEAFFARLSRIRGADLAERFRHRSGVAAPRNGCGRRIDPQRCGVAAVRLSAAWHWPGVNMSKPVIFTITAVWDAEASVWSGHCDDIPAAADAPTLDELMAKISAMALDLLSDNHPDVDPASLFIQITALREAVPAAV